jgi:hypothetical protein
MSKRSVFAFDFRVEDDFELFRNLVQQYSYSRVSRGLSVTPLPPQLISLLAIYLKFGYTKEAKVFAEKTFQIKMTSINTMNKKLKDWGYLIEGKFSKRDKFLHEELQDLKNYVEKAEDNVYLIAYRISISQSKG